MNNNVDIEEYLGLPPRDKIRIYNEVDYYGIRKYIYNKFGIVPHGRSYVSWRHGWYYYPEVLNREMIVLTNQFCKVHLIHNNRIADFFKSIGETNFVKVGMPYIYLDEPVTLIPNSLLVMPNHNVRVTSFARKNDELIRFLDKIYDQKDSFDLIVVVIYGADFERYKDIFERYKKFLFVEGANKDDGNSLLRIYKLLHSFENLASNCIGSHVLYGAYSNCKVSIDKDTFVEPDIKQLQKTPLYRSYPFLLENVRKYSSLEGVEQSYGFLFNELTAGSKHYDWAYEEIGAPFKKSFKEILDLIHFEKTERLINLVKTIPFFFNRNDKKELLIKKFTYLKNEIRYR
jgi:hypothetical protein